MARLASRERLSFSKLREVLALPDLIAVQRESFQWFLDEGVKEVLRDISPIEDFTGQLKLELADHVFDPPKHTEDECRERDMTYARPLFVTARFMNALTGEIKEQTVFMGDFPMMTDRGTFIINGTERIVVSQLVRSPGVYFDVSADKTSPEKDVVGAKMIPGRGAWLEFEVDKKDIAYVRIDRKRKQPVTILLKALGFGDTEDELLSLILDPTGQPVRLDPQHARQGQHRRRRRGVHRHLPQAPSGRAADARLRARAAREPLLQPEALRHGQGRPAQGLEEAPRRVREAPARALRARDADADVEDRQGEFTLSKADILATVSYLVKLHHNDADYFPDDIDHFGNRRVRSVGELIQNQVRVGLSRMERVVRERMTTQDVEAITPQTLINIRPVVAAIKEFFGSSQLSPVHGPDEPARRAHPQAAPVGPRAGRSVA